MERCATLIRVAPEGRDSNEDPADQAAHIMQIVEAFGGTIEGIWAFGGGPFHYVSVAIYPDSVTAAKARAQIEGLGIVTREGYPLSEMRECLQAVAG